MDKENEKTKRAGAVKDGEEVKRGWWVSMGGMGLGWGGGG